jgi:D-alanine-D-alanine ligase-like ATP-grasp enzyme
MFENMIKRSSSIIGNGSSVCSAAHPRSSRGQALAEDDRDYINDIHAFFIQHNITRAIVKPIAGGSSIGVHSVTSAEQAIDIVSKATMPMLIEPFCEGREFTVIVLENSDKEPVALVPTEIQISYKGGAIFDYRRKYLPTSNTSWACPPNFPDAVIQKIRVDAEAIFRLFNMRDFARLDGWVLHDGRILFTDMNPISGMEQNSFIFQQTSRIGMTHQEALLYVLAP